MVVIRGTEETLNHLANRAEDTARQIRDAFKRLSDAVEALTAAGGGLNGKTGSALALVNQLVGTEFTRTTQALDALAAKVRRTGVDLAQRDEDFSNALQQAAESSGSTASVAPAPRHIETTLGGG